jgi:Tol biopolymer transport system component/DNA-binding winged helix-turn-helix (wHTH) protein
MDVGTKEHRRYHFGAYEVNPDTFELRKNGTRIKLREQAFQILILMLERPGEPITREEFRQRLWPDDTFVNFDKSLNTAVNKLRDILGDSVTNPHFVETIPRHGYRFIAEVQTVNGVIQDVLDREPSAAPTPLKTDGPVIASEDSAGRRSVPALVWATLGFLAASLLAWFGYRALWPAAHVESLRAVPLTSYAGVVGAPSFSPDGSQVAFAWTKEGVTNSDIYVQTVGATEPLKLTASPTNASGPAWSPDGSAIAYTQDIPGNRFSIMLIAPTGGEPRKVGELSYPFTLDLTFRNELVSWTPDGKFLMFPDADGGERTAIWRLNISSGLRERITDPKPPVRGHSAPKISADGRRLAYQQRGGRYLYQLLTVPLDRNGQPAGEPALIDHKLNTAPIAWLGTDLLFYGRENITTSLYRWSPAGRVTELRIADINGVGGRLESAGIAANGRRMAIGVSRHEMHVWQMDLSPEGRGLNPRRLITSSFWDTGPGYSRDGRRLVFQSLRSGAPEAWLALADGSGVRQITRFGKVGDSFWSPDGTRIIFDSGAGGHENLYVAEVETGKVHRITNSASFDGRGRWSSDGRWIYFDSDRTGRSEIWRMPDGGGQPIQITSNGGTNPFESQDGKYLYYGKESGGETGGMSYVWRMAVAGGPEERLFPSLVSYASLAMGTRHMYFVRNPHQYPGYGTAIYSYELATGFIRKVAEPGPDIVMLSPSPDERRLVFGAHEGMKADLLLVDDLPK